MAKNLVTINPSNTIFDAKRLIGPKFDDLRNLQDIKNWPFTVVSENGESKIVVEFKGEHKRFTPEEISSIVLSPWIKISMLEKM